MGAAPMLPLIRGILFFTLIGLGSARAQSAMPVLDYEVFKAQVQPVFLNKRPGNARCVTCHTSGNAAYLQQLSPGATTWTEEQSRLNFASIQRLIVPGAPEVSRLLLHPLA